MEEKLEKIYMKEDVDDIEFYRLYRLANKDVANDDIFREPLFEHVFMKQILHNFCGYIKNCAGKFSGYLAFVIFNRKKDIFLVLNGDNKIDDVSRRHKKLQKSIIKKNYGLLDRVFKYFILSKPSVSIYPLKTAFVLFLTWLFLFLQTIYLPFDFLGKILECLYSFIGGLYVRPR